MRHALVISLGYCSWNSLRSYALTLMYLEILSPCPVVPGIDSICSNIAERARKINISRIQELGPEIDFLSLTRALKAYHINGVLYRRYTLLHLTCDILTCFYCFQFLVTIKL